MKRPVALLLSLFALGAMPALAQASRYGLMGTGSDSGS